MIYLTTASIQVSGKGYGDPNSVAKGLDGGGIVRAVIPRSRATKLYDEFRYADVNVPCGTFRTARWMLVATGGSRRMLGWAPARVADEPGSHCEAPVLVDPDGGGPLGPPTIKRPRGPLQPGSRLSAVEGSWTGPPVFAYQWLRCEATDPDDCAPISGQTSKDYVVQSGDVGARVRVDITAKNKDTPTQQTPARSKFTPVVTALPGP